jgi:hypothetical protein
LSKINIYIVFCFILLMGLMSSCGGNAKPVDVTVPSKPSVPSEIPATSPPATTPAPSTAQANRVDVVYFHPKVRCASCISVEVRTRAVINDSFKDAVDSGKLNFLAYELQDKQNASIVKKYGAASSQLFITTVKNNTETIKHIEEVWMPKLLNDGVAFDEFMRNIISQSLKEVS